MVSRIFDIDNDDRLKWVNSDDIRPYVFVRTENRIPNPGQLHSMVDWFKQPPVYKNPLQMDEVGFANEILYLESHAFGPKGLQMPRWVFYDCSIVPGFVAGFVARRASLPKPVSKSLNLHGSSEWTPVSLFIIIPTMKEGEWVAHNLSSANTLVDKDYRYYGLGFLSKCFGLWYANVETCCGMTQWKSPALRLHAQYGNFEILTAFTPVHDYPRTLTYRLRVDPRFWPRFFTKQEEMGLQDHLVDTKLTVNPSDDSSLRALQQKLEKGDERYFLKSAEILNRPLGSELSVYKLRPDQ